MGWQDDAHAFPTDTTPRPGLLRRRPRTNLAGCLLILAAYVLGAVALFATGYLLAALRFS